MSKTSLIFLAPTMLVSALLAGCGGGGADAAQTSQVSAQAASPATVQLEGCVVTSKWMGVRNAAVHARTADGRLIGTAYTDQKGVYVMTVPARSDVVLDTDGASAGDIALNTGSGSFSVGACLQTNL